MRFYGKLVPSSWAVCFCLLSSSLLAETAKNVIYYIGDGMGPSAVTAGRIYRAGSESQLNMERFSFTGISKTYSSNLA